MKIDLKYGNDSEEIPCPDTTFFVGLRLLGASEIGSVSIILFNTDEIFDNATVKTLEKQLPDGTRLLLDCFISEDPAYRRSLEPYKGLKTLEFSYRDLEISATA